MESHAYRIPLLNTWVDNVTTGEAIAEVDRLIRDEKPRYVVTPNTDIVVKMQDDPELKAICDNADLILTDGMVLVRISERLGNPIKERVCMTDFVWDVAVLAEMRGYGVYMLGGKPEVLERAKSTLCEALPGLDIVGAYSPTMGFESDEELRRDVISRIQEAKPDILLVFLGCPKQEKFIANNLQEMGVPISIPMGGCVDFLAGEVKRAPLWMQEHSLEWFYRFLQDPRRLFKRYFVDDLRVFSLAREWGYQSKCGQLSCPNVNPGDASSIAAGVVVYQPNGERLQKCIESLSSQVSKIYIYANSAIDESWARLCGVTVLGDGDNVGIAKALNDVMMAARGDGIEWIVTLDQDSILPDDAVDAFRECIEGESGLGIVCPQAIDSRREYMRETRYPLREYVDMAITSGSCTSVEAWDSVGRYDEWLFIDLVDNDFCKRLRLSGYKIVKLNNIVLSHQFGEIEPKSASVRKRWIALSEVMGIENIAKLSYKKKVVPPRVYYTNRNVIYLNKKLAGYGATAFENYGCRGMLGFQLAFNAPSVLRSHSKREIARVIKDGMVDGLRKEVEPWFPGSDVLGLPLHSSDDARSSSGSNDS